MTIRTFGLHEFGFQVFSLQWTVLLTVIVLAGGGIAGFIIALARTSRIKPLCFMAGIYIQCIQGIPVLILLFLSYYGLGMAGLSLPPLNCCLIVYDNLCFKLSRRNLARVYSGCSCSAVRGFITSAPICVYGSAMSFPHVQGAFQEQLIVDSVQCVPADGLIPGEAAMAEPLAVALHATGRDR